MSNSFDCLFIGHNQMNFKEYEFKLRTMGTKSGAYRDLNLSFINMNDEMYTLSDFYNRFNVGSEDGSHAKLSSYNVFSATIAYLGTYLDRRGFTFDFVNFFQDEKKELENKLKENEYITIAIPTTYYVSVTPILEIMAFIKKHNKNAKVIIGGPYIATQMKVQDEATFQYLCESIGADFYINSSQGEETLVRVLQAIKNGEGFEEIQNITYKTREKYISNPLKTEDNKLEDNMVNWKLFKEKVGNILSVRTSISCAFSCSFCGFPQHAGKYQTAGIEKIEDELNQIESLGKVTCVNFIDDTFNVPIERFKDILRMMIKNKYSFKWNSHFRCQYADEETIHLMKESGCEGVFLGIESGNQQVLNNMNKHSTIEKYAKGIELLNEAGIFSYASFIIGFPGETEETVLDTVNFIENTRPDFFRTQLWYCDPFTPIWKQKDKYNIKNSQFEWSHSGMNANDACDMIDNIFLNVKNSVWLPQNDFDFLGIFGLLQRGWSLDRVKSLIRAFNDCVREKVAKENVKNCSSYLVNSLKDVIVDPIANELIDFQNSTEDSLDVEFDF